MPFRCDTATHVVGSIYRDPGEELFWVSKLVRRAERAVCSVANSPVLTLTH